MKNQTHTPGPWRFFTDTRHGPWNTETNKPGNPWYHQWWIESDSRKLMALLEVPCLSTSVDHKQRVVTEHEHTKAEVEANARLIAAAPELLSALIGMLEWARRVKGQNPGPEVYQALAAVGKARAKGEACTGST